MINGIVSFVWGNCSEDAEQSFKSLSNQVNKTTEIECREGEDDWLIVGKELPVAETGLDTDEEDVHKIDELDQIIDRNAIFDEDDRCLNDTDQVIYKGAKNCRRKEPRASNTDTVQQRIFKSSNIFTPDLEDPKKQENMFDFEVEDVTRLWGTFLERSTALCCNDLIIDLDSRVCSPVSSDSEWSVTPPLCFSHPTDSNTRFPTTRLRDSNLELENFLIEHPNICKRIFPKRPMDKETMKKKIEAAAPMNLRRMKLHEKQAIFRNPYELPSDDRPRLHSPKFNCIQTNVQAQIEKVEPATKAHHESLSKILSRRHLKMQNKAQMHGAKQHKRRDRMCKLPSGANNNRKC